jgi:hypothetical protein
MPLAPPIPITEFTPRERPDPYNFAALDVRSQPAWRFEKGVHYERTEEHLLKWARRHAHEHGLKVKYNSVKDTSNKVVAIELAFSANSDSPTTTEDPHR